MKAALIAGATGLTGKNLLYSLLNNKNYVRVFILVRKELAIKDAKLTQLVFNYDNDQNYQDLPVVDDVFCCLGTTIKKAGSEEAFIKVDMDYPVKLADICSKKGCKNFLIVTALGADKNSRVFYNRVKGQVEEKIKIFIFDAIYFCRPSILLGDRAELRVGEEIGKFLSKLISLFLFGTWRKYKAIESSVLANAMVELAAMNEKGVHVIESDRLQVLGRKDGKVYVSVV